MQDIIEWNDFGQNYSLYIKKRKDSKGEACLSMIFEDYTYDKVTEINIPADKMKHFLKLVNPVEKSGLSDINQLRKNLGQL